MVGGGGSPNTYKVQKSKKFGMFYVIILFDVYDIVYDMLGFRPPRRTMKIV